MNNLKFILGLGLFWLLFSALLLTTGYWPSLHEFGVSERLFFAVAWAGLAAGTLAVGTYSFAGRSET